MIYNVLLCNTQIYNAFLQKIKFTLYYIVYVKNIDQYHCDLVCLLFYFSLTHSLTKSLCMKPDCSKNFIAAQICIAMSSIMSVFSTKCLLLRRYWSRQPKKEVTEEVEKGQKVIEESDNSHLTINH